MSKPDTIPKLIYYYIQNKYSGLYIHIYIYIYKFCTLRQHLMCRAAYPNMHRVYCSYFKQKDTDG